MDFFFLYACWLFQHENIFSHPGYFYAPSEPGCTVLALATDQDNNILVSGDSSGYITVWDVHGYCTMRLELSVAKVFGTFHKQ